MKKLLIFFILLAVLTFSGCASNKTANNTDKTGSVISENTSKTDRNEKSVKSEKTEKSNGSNSESKQVSSAEDGASAPSAGEETDPGELPIDYAD